MSLAFAYILNAMAFLREALKPAHVGLLASVYIVYRIVYNVILWPRYFSPLRALPTPPNAKFLMGHSHIIADGESGVPFQEWAKELGPVVRTLGPIGMERLIFVQPEQLHQVLTKDWLDYPRPSYLRHILGIVSGYGLLTVTGNEHRLMRKAMNPAFSLHHLASQVHMYYNPIDRLVKILNDHVPADPLKGKVIHLYDWISGATLDIICETAFGYKADSLHNPNNELAHAYQKLAALQTGQNLLTMYLLMMIPGMPKLLMSSWMYRHRRWLTYTAITDRLRILLEVMHTTKKVSAKLLQEKTDDIATEEKRDIMSILVRARKADIEHDHTAYAMSDTAMRDQVLTFLNAGHDTTASGLSWALWLLANDQVSQRRLRDEVAPVLRKNPHPDYRTLKELEWLNCVIMESLRVLPSVPATARVANKAGYIGDILVPKGTMIYIPIRAVNTYKGVWGEDAEEFKPSRWLNLPKEYNPNYSFLSFLAGPHACIGRTMAIMEMKAVLASLIAHFTFEPAFEGQTAKPVAAITMKPSDGLPLLVKRVQ